MEQSEENLMVEEMVKGFIFFKSMSYTKRNAEFARVPLFKMLQIAIASQSF